MQRLIDPVFLQLGVDGLGEAGLREPDHLRAFDVEFLFQVGLGVVLNDGVRGEVGQDLLAAFFRDIARDQHEVQFTFAARQRIAAHEQRARLQDEREQPLDGFGWSGSAQATFTFTLSPLI